MRAELAAPRAGQIEGARTPAVSTQKSTSLAIGPLDLLGASPHNEEVSGWSP